VSECANRGWQIKFRRMLGQEEMDEWIQLQEVVRGAVISQEEDTILWGLTPSKQFTTSSLYKFLTTGGVSSRMGKKI
jgi:hypothetical protein